ncbi:MAG: 4-hydroxythreonine-4-phosphate dehydrogenase PdxA [bacterium]
MNKRSHLHKAVNKTYPVPRLAVTMGDPCGIGPEIIVKSLEPYLQKSGPGFVLAGDESIMNEAARRYSGPAFRDEWKKAWRTENDGDISGASSRLVLLSKSKLDFSRLPQVRPGPAEGRAMASYLEAGLELVRSGECRALVTAPVSKAGLRAGGFNYPGHTDWLGEMTGAQPVMMMAAGRLRTVPLTVHIPLAQVPASLTEDLVEKTVLIVDRELKQKFRIKRPRLVVAGLNPHAGEQGLLGREEDEIMSPAIESSREKGVLVSGPYPADTLFTSRKRKEFDVALCPYHDQAMLPVKTLAEKKAVNITLGLPLIRTSPAHGTSPHIAWQGKADHRSMEEAIKTAARLAGVHR